MFKITTEHQNISLVAFFFFLLQLRHILGRIFYYVYYVTFNL